MEQDAVNEKQDVKSVYDLDLDILISIKSENGKNDTKLQSDLNAPFTLILFAINNVADGLNKIAKGRTQEELLRMTLKDVMAPISETDKANDSE